MDRRGARRRGLRGRRRRAAGGSQQEHRGEDTCSGHALNGPTSRGRRTSRKTSVLDVTLGSRRRLWRFAVAAFVQGPGAGRPGSPPIGEIIDAEEMRPGARPARPATLLTAAAALGVLCLAACGLSSPPTSGASPRPTLSLPVPSGSPGAGLPERTIPAPTISARPEPTATPPATEPPATPPPATEPPPTAPPATAPPATQPPATAPPATAPPATVPPATAPAATEAPTATPAPTEPPTATPTATASPTTGSTSNAPGWWLFLTGVVAGLAHRSA